MHDLVALPGRGYMGAKCSLQQFWTKNKGLQHDGGWNGEVFLKIGKSIGESGEIAPKKKNQTAVWNRQTVLIIGKSLNHVSNLTKYEQFIK